MAEYKLKLTEEQKSYLKEKANAGGQTMQEYIISKLFDTPSDIFTGAVAFQRAIDSKEQLKEKPFFEVRDLYTEEEYLGINRGKAGALGRAFYVQVSEINTGIIQYIDGGFDGQRARYRFIS